MSQSNLEPGYRAVLVREETKRKLQDLRKGLPEKDLFQERRLATAALEYCLGDEVARRAMLALARRVVLKDLETIETTRP